MRLAVLALLAACATPALAQDDCATKLTDAIARQDTATLDRLIGNQVDRSIVLEARSGLSKANDLRDQEMGRLELLLSLRATPGNTYDQTNEIGDLIASAEKLYKFAEAEMASYGSQLEAIVKRACGDAQTAVATAPVLKLIGTYPVPRDLEWKEAEPGRWVTVVNGKRWVVTDGRVTQNGGGLSLVVTWTRPPKAIGADGLKLDLSIDASSTGALHQPAVHAQSRWFLFTPDPPQAGVSVSGNEAGNRISVTMKAPVEIVYDGLNHEFAVGSMFGAGLAYVYSVDQPKLPPSQ